MVNHENRSDVICVVGLGYVGLPLSIVFDEEGFDVIGYDIDEEKVVALQNGVDPIKEVGDEHISTSTIEFTADPTHIERADYVLITVPTPIDDLKNPELTFVKSAGRTVGEHMADGTTVILESTVYPGVTRDQLVPILESNSGLTLGEDFYVGYSPERLSPGDTSHGLRDVTKVVSGCSPETVADLAALYESIIDAGVYEASTLEAAEASKVIENVQRDLNIALVNELAIICEHMGIETRDVLDAAGTKWNFHEYDPGLVGGHCIPVDPLYLASGSERAGYSPNLILQGREVNDYMPKHVAELTMQALNRSGRVLKDARLLILGLAYKANIGDIRTSDVRNLISELGQYGIETIGYDPHAEDTAMREHFEIDVQEELDYEDFDGLILATPHQLMLDQFDFRDAVQELNDDPIVIDVHAALDPDRAEANGFRYRTL